jgi:hypothetical protein
MLDVRRWLVPVQIVIRDNSWTAACKQTSHFLAKNGAESLQRTQLFPRPARKNPGSDQALKSPFAC